MVTTRKHYIPVKQRVTYHKVTQNEKYHNFLIGQKLIFDDALLFVYKDDNEDVEKIIPVKDLGPHLRFAKFKDVEDEDGNFKNTGGAYSVNEKVIFNYTPKKFWL